MALVPRQARFYKNRVNIWRPAYTIDGSTSQQTATPYSLIASNVACLYTNNQSPEEPSDIGRYEISSIFTRDSYSFDVAQDVRSGDILKDVTTDRFGTTSPKSGSFWDVAGDAQIFPSLGGRNANCRIVKAVQNPRPPDGVS